MSETLAVDIGDTVVRGLVVADGAEAEPLTAGGEPMPAVVARTGGARLAAGLDARDAAVRLDPSAVRRAPRTWLEPPPAWTAFSAADGLEALVRAELRLARSVRDGISPGRLVLTHHPLWGSRRQEVLGGAAARAARGAEILLVPDPIAVAELHRWEGIGPDLHPGTRILVVDIGGLSCTASVLRSEQGGFQVAGRPMTVAGSAGDAIDDGVLAHVAGLLARRSVDLWTDLVADVRAGDANALRELRQLREGVRRAKEALGGTQTTTLAVPLRFALPAGLLLTREELVDVATPVVDRVVQAAEVAIEDAEVGPADLGSIHLGGGSAALPLVGERLWARFDVQPHVAPDPGGSVVRGAARWSTPGTRRGRARPTVEGASAALEVVHEVAGRWAAAVLTRGQEPRVVALEQVSTFTRRLVALDPMTGTTAWERRSFDGRSLASGTGVVAAGAAGGCWVGHDDGTVSLCATDGAIAHVASRPRRIPGRHRRVAAVAGLRLGVAWVTEGGELVVDALDEPGVGDGRVGLGGHPELGLVVSPDGRSLAVVHPEEGVRTVRLTATGPIVGAEVLRGPTLDAAWVDDQIVTVTTGVDVIVVDTVTGSVKARLTDPGFSPERVAVRPDGALVVAADRVGHLAVWRARPDWHTVDPHPAGRTTGEAPGGDLRALAFDSAGDRLVCATSDRVLVHRVKVR